jgi:acylphosphatase
MSAAQIKINGKLYPIEQLIGKIVFASKDTLLERNLTGKDKAEFQVKKGGSLGKIHSWVNNKNNGKVYAMFNTNAASILAKYPAGSYYVPFDAINETELKQQGAKTTEQVTEEEEEKKRNENLTFGEKIAESLQKGALYIFGGYVVIQVVKGLFNGSKD